MSNMKLKEFIKAIRNCKTAKDERAVVAKESALIRNAFKVQHASTSPRGLDKRVLRLGYILPFARFASCSAVLNVV